MERGKLLFTHFKVALTEMFSLRRTDMNTYWKRKSGVFPLFMSMFICLMLPLTFNMNFKNKDVVAFCSNSERLVSHYQSQSAS